MVFRMQRTTAKRSVQHVPSRHKAIRNVSRVHEQTPPADESGVVFRFERDTHTYFLGGVEIPHITSMLETAGYVDSRWYTERSRQRGTAVHELTMLYDLGAMDPTACVSPYKGWLLAHVKAMSLIRPDIDEIEIPHVHVRHRFGGRPDRRGRIYDRRGLLEIKSGGYEAAHRVQLALQAILVEEEERIPAEHLARFCLYLQDNGRFKLEEFKDRSDFDRAREVIRVCC